MEGRDEGLSQPGVQQPEHLVGVQGEDHPLAEAPQPVRDPFQGGDRRAGRFPERLKEAALGRFDRPAVEAHHRRPFRARPRGEGIQQARLADAADAVQVEDGRPVFRQGSLEEGQLLRPTDKALDCPVRKQLLQLARHGSAPGWGPDAGGYPAPGPEIAADCTTVGG